jgi:DNA-binding GntR family transcriptional regulator
MEKIGVGDHSLSNIIAEKITEDIISGKLEPGEKVVEGVYAEQYGTSRAPIREALYILSTQGLIERIPRKGSVVKGYSQQEVYDLLEIRMMLEEMAMKRIANKGVKRQNLNQMEQLIPSMAQNIKETKAYAELNHNFHMEIIKMSGSATILNMYSRLGIPLLSLQTMSFLEEETKEKSIQEHKTIIQLLNDQQIEAAIAILKKHNNDVIGRIEEQINNE